MTTMFRAERVKGAKTDWFLVFLVATIALSGFSVLLSASHHFSVIKHGDGMFLFTKQLMWGGLGIVACIIASIIPLSVVRSLVPVGVILGLVLMVLPFIPGIGLNLMGGRRWIAIGSNTFQPSEYAKFILVLYLAHMLDKRQETLDKPSESLIPPFLMASAFIGLVVVQGDFSTSILLSLVVLSIFFVAGTKLRFIFAALTIIVPVASYTILTSQYRLQRFVTFLDPLKDPLGSGYQVLTSQQALQSGGLLGQGIGLGQYKLGKLPEAHQDYVFAVAGEELGFIGVMALMLLFALFLYRSISHSLRLKDGFSRYLSFGLSFWIGAQALMHMAVVSGILPATGIPMPFFSNGGSSLFVTLAACGLLFNALRSGEEAPHG